MSNSINMDPNRICANCGATRGEHMNNDECPNSDGRERFIPSVMENDDLIGHLRASGLKAFVIDENTDFSKLADEMRAEGLPIAVLATPEGYRNKEAFCLMWYKCVRRPDVVAHRIAGAELHLSNRTGCGHAERFWNSRDGVTPFATWCPSCGGEMQHDRFDLDRIAVDHVPHPGQKIWVNMSKSRAEERVKKRIAILKKHRKAWVRPEMDRDDYVQTLIDHEYKDGTAPDCFIMPFDGEWNEIKDTLNFPN